MLNSIRIKTFGPNFNSFNGREFLIELKNFYRTFYDERLGTRLNIEVRAMTEHGPLTLLCEALVGKAESYTHRVKIDAADGLYVTIILTIDDSSKTEVVSITEVEYLK